MILTSINVVGLAALSAKTNFLDIFEEFYQKCCKSEIFQLIHFDKNKGRSLILRRIVSDSFLYKYSEFGCMIFEDELSRNFSAILSKGVF